MNDLRHPHNIPELVDSQNTANVQNQRRIHRRCDVNQTARLSIPGDAASACEAQILDVSRRGMQLLVADEVPGLCVHVGWRAREVVGLIRHQRQEKGGFLLGIELEPGSEAVIVEILVDNAAELEISNKALQAQAEGLKRTKERLVAYAEALAKKNDDLCRAVDAARQASQFKSRFLASVSHELRTPLNGIIGFAQMFHDGTLGSLNEEQQECVGDMLSCSDHLLTLISQVIDLTKIESGKMSFHYQEVSLVKLIRDSIATLQAIAESKRISVEFLADTAIDNVEADPGKLKQVLYNYLSNALKFTPEGGRIQVSISLDGPSSYRIGVRDTGRGIAPDDICRLFTEFGQLCAGKAPIGSGLGLAIT
jgi:signal transduction histidine kinase